MFKRIKSILSNLILRYLYIKNNNRKTYDYYTYIYRTLSRL
jgi:hypothetical protein